MFKVFARVIEETPTSESLEMDKDNLNKLLDAKIPGRRGSWGDIKEKFSYGGGLRGAILAFTAILMTRLMPYLALLPPINLPSLRKKRMLSGLMKTRPRQNQDITAIGPIP